MTQQWKNTGTVISGSPCQDIVSGKISWAGIHFNSVCEEIAFLNDTEILPGANLLCGN
jgi:hypothetical protein